MAAATSGRTARTPGGRAKGSRGDGLKLEDRVEREHAERSNVADSTDAASRWIVNKTAHVAAELLANHLVPGFGGPIVNAAEFALRFVGALGDPGQAAVPYDP
jgi:hypothetical protein